MTVMNREIVDQSLQKPVLESIHGALKRESHILFEHPPLLWQQVFNRLQWDQRIEPSITSGAYEQHNDLEVRPWIRTKNPYRETSTLERVFQGHTGAINACAFNPTSDRILSVSTDGTARIWNLHSGAIEDIYELHDVLYCCDWSPRDHQFCAGTRLGKVTLFDTTSHSMLTFDNHEDYVYSCSFSPDGQYILSGGGDRILRLWNVKTGKEEKQYVGHSSGVLSCIFSRDGKHIISSSNDLSVCIWDVESGQQLQKIAGHLVPINAIAVSHNNQYFMTGGSDLFLTVRENISGNEVFKIETKHKGINTCGFSLDDTEIFLAGGNDLIIYDMENQECLDVFVGHTAPLSDCHYSPNGKYILTSSQDKTMRLWEASVSKGASQIGHNDSVTKCTFNFSGSDIVSGGADGNLIFWNSQNGNQTKKIKAHESGISDCSYNKSGSLVASGGLDKSVKMWNVENPINPAVLYGHWGKINTCEFSPDESIIASSSQDDTIRIWGVKNAQPLLKIDGQYYTFSPDGTQLLTLSVGILDKNNFQLFDMMSNTIITNFPGHSSGITRFRFDHGGKYVISSSEDHSVKIWNILTGAVVFNFSRHNSEVNWFDISPDDQTIVSIDADGALFIWKFDGGEVIHSVDLHNHQIEKCMITPDSNFVLLWGKGKLLTVLDMITGNQKATFPVFDMINSLALHPYKPMIVCGDNGGNTYILDLVNMHYTSIKLTAFEKENRLTYTCPSCLKTITVDHEMLGKEFVCHSENCELKIKLNSSYIKQRIFTPPPKGRTGLFSKRR